MSQAADAWSAAMAAGDFAAAWAANDRVLARRPPAERDDPRQPYHLRWVWDGTPIDGRDVLVRCYHGLGDTVQFCRYLPALRRRAAHVTLEMQPELIPLVSLLGAADRILPFDPAAPLADRACNVEIMELGHALRLAPQPVPYLPFPRGTRCEGLRVGLCWRVNAGWRPERSVPDERLIPLLSVPGVALQSLQKGAALDGMAPCPGAVLDTARVIAGLDLVITVDTMVAHLAGGIGVPTWLLLDTEPDWRWWAGGLGSPQSGLQGSPWYCGVRKYRQERAGDWGPPLGALVADLTRCSRAGTVDV